MWMLKDVKGSIKYLKPNKTIKVGRKDADIILENDSSISRAHASLTVTLKKEVQTSEESSTCLIKDINSKYGSFIVRNGSKLKVSKEGLELHHGDTLTFGLQNCTYSVEYIHFVTAISRLNEDHGQKLESIVNEIGGLIINRYNAYCTHLTASVAATTTKIISSLIAGIPVVGINYWIQVRKCVEENKALPDPNPFVLSLQDAGVNVRKVSLKPNPSRKTLFQKKTFIFFTSKSYEEYRNMIQQAGGDAKVHPMGSTIPDNLFSNDYIIMKVATNDSTAAELIEFDTLLQNKMKEKNLRTINETEIPLAVIYASLDQYCNPQYDFMKLLKRKKHAEDTSEVLALDTQDITGVAKQNTKHIVSKPNLIAETNEIPATGTQSQEYQSDQDFQITNTSKQDKYFEMRNEKTTVQVKKDNEVSSYVKKSNEKTKTFNFTKEKEASSTVSSYKEDDPWDKKRSKTNKRQREASDCDDIADNIQQLWPSKKRSSIEVTKTKPEFKPTKYVKSELKMPEENDDQKNKTDKWGFKKSNKKFRDFDLDDLDDDESKKVAKKRKYDLLDSQKKESPENLDLDDAKEIIEESNDDLPCNSNKPFVKKKTKTIVEPEADFELKKIQLKVNPLDTKNQKSFIKSRKTSNREDQIDQGKNTLIKQPLVMKREVDVDRQESCGKIFQKIYNQIPVTRVPLAEMTIWRPN